MARKVIYITDADERGIIDVSILRLDSAEHFFVRAKHHKIVQNSSSQHRKSVASSNRRKMAAATGCRHTTKTRRLKKRQVRIGQSATPVYHRYMQINDQ